MSSQYSHRTPPKPGFDPESLQPLLSSVAQLLVLALILVVSLWSRNSFKSYSELVQMAFGSILSGRAFGANKVDWTATSSSSTSSSASLGGGKGSTIRRRYADTQQGTEAWNSSNLHFPGLLNAAGNLCFLNATLQALASLPTLITYLDSLLTTSESLSYGLPVTYALYDTLIALNTPSTSSRPPPLRPVQLASALADSSPTRKRLLASSEQQDAHELWGMIRDAVEEEARKLAHLVERTERATRGSGLNEVVKLKNGFRIETVVGDAKGKGKRTTMNDPWFWLRSQRVKCMNCGYVRDTRHEAEELLMLNVPPVSSCSLYDLLQEYTKADLISDYACRKCCMLATLDKYKLQRDRLAAPATSSSSSTSSSTVTGENGKGKDSKMTNSRKDRKRKIQKLVDKIQTVVDAGDFEKLLEQGEAGAIKMERASSAAGKNVNLARTPETLLVHLNRSTHYGYSGPIKNSCRVVFPEYLDLDPFCDHHDRHQHPNEIDKGKTKTLYRLSSMVVHYGSHHFGHYVAFRRRPRPPPASTTTTPTSLDSTLPDWYRISDETVQVSSIGEVVNNNPFLLFYERHDQEDHHQLDLSQTSRAAETVTLPRVVESWRIRGGQGTVDEGDQSRAEP
ncbi:ubiquitin carboxyl-terminal hydrolase [Sporobolomyces koalae]|uniref:ubiquitin carboxyl-terminal hydrolase n=1 Tax=Sporobolomyces koalae TaxID=500713 RepID=UPI00317A8DD6